MTDPTPEFRPSGNLCSVADCPIGFPIIGWFWDGRVWQGACIEHATVIPPWRKGDWKYHKKIVRGI